MNLQIDRDRELGLHSWQALRDVGCAQACSRSICACMRSAGIAMSVARARGESSRRELMIIECITFSVYERTSEAGRTRRSAKTGDSASTAVTAVPQVRACLVSAMLHQSLERSDRRRKEVTSTSGDPSAQTIHSPLVLRIHSQPCPPLISSTRSKRRHPGTAAIELAPSTLPVNRTQAA